MLQSEGDAEAQRSRRETNCITSIPPLLIYSDLQTSLQSSYPVAGICMSYESVRTMKRACAKGFCDVCLLHAAGSIFCGITSKRSAGFVGLPLMLPSVS